MKTMPRTTLMLMRFVTQLMLTRIARWEDRHARPEDYRMSELNSGLWQASDSMRAILQGEFNAMRKNDHVGTVGKAWRVEEKLTPEYVTEMFGDTSVPLHPVN